MRIGRLQASRFFRERVPVEEQRLLGMFGAAYAAYAAATPILIPGVHGFWSTLQYRQASSGDSTHSVAREDG